MSKRSRFGRLKPRNKKAAQMRAEQKLHPKAGRRAGEKRRKWMRVTPAGAAAGAGKHRKWML